MHLKTLRRQDSNGVAHMKTFFCWTLIQDGLMEINNLFYYPHRKCIQMKEFCRAHLWPMQCHNIFREPFEWMGGILHKFILPIVVFCVGQLHEYLILLRSSLTHLCMSGACIVVPLFTVAASLMLLCQENFSFVYLLKWAWVYWATVVGKNKTW